MNKLLLFSKHTLLCCLVDTRCFKYFYTLNDKTFQIYNGHPYKSSRIDVAKKGDVSFDCVIYKCMELHNGILDMTSNIYIKKGKLFVDDLLICENYLDYIDEINEFIQVLNLLFGKMVCITLYGIYREIIPNLTIKFPEIIISQYLINNPSYTLETVFKTPPINVTTENIKSISDGTIEFIEIDGKQYRKDYFLKNCDILGNINTGFDKEFYINLAKHMDIYNKCTLEDELTRYFEYLDEIWLDVFPSKLKSARLI